MIINIRGTSGTGKSTLARSLMALYEPNPLRYRREGRKQPLGYRYCRPYKETNESFNDLAVVGHYETDCGGADTITDYDDLFNLIREGAKYRLDVLFEGLLISGDVKRTAELHRWALEQQNELHVIAMQVPIEECLDSVNARRRAKAQRVAGAKGTEPVERPDVNPKNTIAKHRGLTLACQRLEAEGVTVHRPQGRVAAYNLCKQLLRLS
jgi:hypothetical protein